MPRAVLVLGDARQAKHILAELGVAPTLLLTDPPYHARGGPVKHAGSISDINDVFAGSRGALLGISSVLEALAQNANAVIFVNNGPAQCLVHKLLEERGFAFKQKLYLINKTPTPQFRKSAFRSMVQEAVWYSRGSAPFNFLSQSEMKNAFFWASAEKETKYPGEKPVKMFKTLVEALSNPGDWVLDPFCGSGTTAVASLEAGRNAVCVDINPKAIEVQKERLRKRGFEFEFVQA